MSVLDGLTFGFQNLSEWLFTVKYWILSFRLQQMQQNNPSDCFPTIVFYSGLALAIAGPTLYGIGEWDFKIIDVPLDIGFGLI